MTTHLILGGLGFIGRHVAQELMARGHRVRLVDIAAPGKGMIDNFDPNGGSVTFETVDLANADWARLLNSVDIVHHYAWSTIPQTANDDPQADLESNVGATLRLLEAIRRREPDQRPTVVFSSSGGTVYGRLTEIPVPETHVFGPITAYGVSKATSELYLAFYSDVYGLDCRVARISNPFGAGQNPQRPQGAASAFLFKAVENEPITIWGDGSVVRDFLHICDVAEALVTIALAPSETCGNPAVFNIGSGLGVSLNGIIDTLSDLLGTRPDVRYVDGRNFDIPVSVLDVTRIAERLGWEPRLTFSQGCQHMINDIQQGQSWLSTSIHL